MYPALADYFSAMNYGKKWFLLFVLAKARLKPRLDYSQSWSLNSLSNHHPPKLLRGFEATYRAEFQYANLLQPN